MFYDLWCLIIGIRPRDHHHEHRLDQAVLMVVLKCPGKIWGASYGRFTVWVGGMSRKASKFDGVDEKKTAKMICTVVHPKHAISCGGYAFVFCYI